MGSTRHWHTHDDKMDFIMGMLEFKQFSMPNFKQMIDVQLIKILKFCVELI